MSFDIPHVTRLEETVGWILDVVFLQISISTKRNTFKHKHLIELLHKILLFFNIHLQSSFVIRPVLCEFFTQFEPGLYLERSRQNMPLELDLPISKSISQRSNAKNNVTSGFAEPWSLNQFRLLRAQTWVRMKTIHKMSRQTKFRADKTCGYQLLHSEHMLKVKSLSFQKWR